MIALKLEILDPKAMKPMGNPFGVKCIEIVSRSYLTHITVVETGISIELPKDMELTAISCQEGLSVLGWTIDKRGLKLTVIRESGYIKFEEPFAKIYLVKREVVPVRFIEFTPEGKRMICGEPIITQEIPKG